MEQPRLIFISYARKDGRDLALRFQTDFQAAGYKVWLDTAQLETGANWSLEIEEAIDHCDAVLILLSKGSYNSVVCRGEQLRALRKNKRVLPVLVQPDADRPVYLEHLNYRASFDPALYGETLRLLLVEMTSNPLAPLPEFFRSTPFFVPSHVPPLPRHFIARPAELERLRQALLSDNATRQTALTAVQGLGGIGKTVLAKALCQDEAILNAFPDGIVWVPIGRDAGNMGDEIKFVGKKLGDSESYYTSELMAADRLRDFLPQKTALIVLDDVWSPAQVKPFIVDAPRCQVLFTTRDEGVARHPDIAANIVSVGVMKPEQAAELLRKLAGRDDPDFPEIAKRLGYLTLALKLVGSQLQDTGMSGRDWLKSFHHISQITLGYEADPNNPHESLKLCFDLSMQVLKREEDRFLYAALGIFPEEVSIPYEVVAQLWQRLAPNMDNIRLAQLVAKLNQLALIERNMDNSTITLHDLLLDYARERLGDRYAAGPGRSAGDLGRRSLPPAPYLCLDVVRLPLRRSRAV